MNQLCQLRTWKEAIASQNTVTIAVLALFIVESYFKMPVSSHPSARLSLAPQSQEDHTNICSCEARRFSTHNYQKHLSQTSLTRDDASSPP